MHIWYTLIVNMAFENVLLVVILIGVVLFGAQNFQNLLGLLERGMSKQDELTSEPTTDNDRR